MNVCTIAGRRDLARARVMANTLRRYHPDASLTAVLLDCSPDEAEDLSDIRVVRAEAIVGESFGLLAGANPPGALPMAVLPYVMRAMLDSHEAPVLYIGAGQRLLAPLAELVELLRDHAVVLVARATNGALRVASESGPTPGVYSQQLFGLGCDPGSAALLDAWPRYFAVAADDGAEARRTWIDRIPALVENVCVLRDPGYGLDPWSLSGRELSKSTGAPGDGDSLLVDGRAARAFDFSQFDPDNPELWFDGKGARPGVAPVLVQLTDEYALELQSAGWSTFADTSSPYLRLDDGLRLNDTIRALLIEAITDGSVARSPFSHEGRVEFYKYLNEPDRRGSAVGLTRLHMAIWDRRSDLSSTYPNVDGPDGEGYAGWLCMYGEEEEGLVSELLPPTPRIAYRDADPSIHEQGPRWGVNVVGFFTSELGVGQAARLLVSGLDARRIPVMPIQGRLVPPSRQGADFSYTRPDDAAFPVNVICINGDGVPLFAREAGRSFFEGRYTIGMWWWEVGQPPASWTAAYEFLDEVWVASRHIRDLIEPSAPVPVVDVTLPVLTPSFARRTRKELGLPTEGFLFLCLHDYHSVSARKNPVGLINAFKKAFSPGSGAKLVIKSINAQSRVGDHERVVLAAKNHPDIAVLDYYLADAEKNAMIANCDCYVSLHRSEGFGLPLAEAMLLGKPVIATRFGGNTDYMNDRNAYLVDYEAVVVGDGAYPYPPDGVWAEPDLDHAARLMRQVFSAREEAADRGRIGRRDLLAHHAPAAAGTNIERRLAFIFDRLYREGSRSLNLAHLPSVLDGDFVTPEVGPSPSIDWGSGRMAHMNWRAHRPVADWTRAYIEHRGSVDADTYRAIADTQLVVGRLDARLRELARALHDQQNAAHAEALAALRRIESRLTQNLGGDEAPELDGPGANPISSSTAPD